MPYLWGPVGKDNLKLWGPVGKCGILRICWEKKKLKNDMLIHRFLVMRDILVTR